MNSHFNGAVDLFDAYIELISATLSAKSRLRLCRAIRYDDSVEASNQATAQLILAAVAAYEEATQKTVTGFRQSFTESQRLLNEEIGAANDVYQGVEKLVAASIDTHKELAQLTRRKDALLFAASELGDSDLEGEAARQFDEARQALFARRDAALADARGVYQRDIACMHLRHQERLRLRAAEETAFIAPHRAVKDQAVDDARLAHNRLVAREQHAAAADLAALENQFYQEEQTRLEELAQLKLAAFDKSASTRFLDYCERSTRLLKERVESA